MNQVQIRIPDAEEMARLDAIYQRLCSGYCEPSEGSAPLIFTDPDERDRILNSDASTPDRS